MIGTISKTTARRFVLGRQGLWPGRRWRGKEDLLAALTAMEALQEDPLNVVARSHDIVLASRVLGYAPSQLDELIYGKRQAFEYGGALFAYPMSELPYWRLPMARRRVEGRFATFAAEHPALVDDVRSTLAARGPLGNRDFEGTARIVGNYRGRKDTALALYYLWLTGEVLLHHRVNFQRMYDLTERIAPEEHRWEAPAQAAEQYFARKEIALYGLITERLWRNVWAGDIRRKPSAEEAARLLAEMKESGTVQALRIEGSKDDWLVLGEDLHLLEAVDAGTAPAAWQPLETTTEEEAVLLAPLDIVSARGRAKFLFDFDYVWEVYKPAEQRRWGYYTLPILYGDRLVARVDPRFERQTKTLRLLGFWTEPDAPVGEAQFADALGRGLARFAAMLGAERVDVGEMQPAALREHVARQLRRAQDGNNGDRA